MREGVLIKEGNQFQIDGFFKDSFNTSQQNRGDLDDPFICMYVYKNNSNLSSMCQ